ncbi:MAG: ABC transporter permease [Bdellovibrionaceae bacterium]|nr:ABC transporter permease [Pseudobdellovibrionaceae bacterium]
MVVILSFSTRGVYGGIEWTLSFASYERVFSVRTAQVLWQSFLLAFSTAVVCSVLGLLCAWYMTTVSSKWRPWLLGMIALPFLTNLVIRVYAIKHFVGVNGPVQFFLRAFEIPYDPFSLTANSWLVWYGLISTYLPFAVLPLYGAFEKFDFQLVEAAKDLGAGSWSLLVKVIAPALSAPLAGAFFLVFIPCLGEYVIPDLLGGAKTMLWGNLITEQFLKARDWPMGAALAVTLLGCFALILGVRSLLLARRHRE